MLISWLPKLGRTGFAAIFGLVGVASASNWCPSVSDDVISCSNCSRILTCNYEGKITITGDNVELDGNSYWIYNSPGVGLEIRGSAFVYNLLVYNSASSGIVFTNTSTSEVKYGSLENVSVWEAGDAGIVNASGNASRPFYVSIYSSNVISSRYYGVNGYHSVATSPAGTEISYSLIQGSGYEGYNTSRGQPTIHWGNQYTDNLIGASITEHGGGYYSNNTFSNNRSLGFYLQNFSPTPAIYVYSNTGYGNINDDCFAAGGSNLSFYGNSFTTHTRCN